MNDSIWAIVAGAVKGFGLGLDAVINDISYSNIIMLSSTLPDYDSGRYKDKTKNDNIIKADDKNNRQIVRDFFKSIE